MTDTTDAHYAALHTAGPFPRMMAGFLSVFRKAPAERPVVTTPGPAVEALIDADYARLASHGSWDALRDDLRAHAARARSKAA